MEGPGLAQGVVPAFGVEKLIPMPRGSCKYNPMQMQVWGYKVPWERDVCV